MSVQSLVPTNSKLAGNVAVKAFLKFLLAESVSKDSINASILADPSGNTFVAIMDKFAWYLALNKNQDGKHLARNTVLSYFRQTKKWLLGLFNSQQKAVNDRLLKMAQTLDKYCLKREQGGVVKKAPACSKLELHLLMEHFYKQATSGTDYQDAAPVYLMWYVFGRASDLSLVRKQSLSVSASDVLFLRLVRVKTSEEQGLSLYPDRDDVTTCPILAIALALMMQSSPCAALLDQVPRQTSKAEASVGESVSLLELLSSDPVDEGMGFSAEPGAKTPSSREPGIYSYVNRILKHSSKLAGVESELASHSFRRGGVQRANGDHQLSAQWIFDRGAWNLTTTNKAFAYVSNTTTEDQKIARVLSGWKAGQSIQIVSLACFDSQTKEKIAAVQALLFATCTNRKAPSVAVDPRVLDTCTAYLLRNFPVLRELNEKSPVVVRVEECCIEAGFQLSELMSWSIELQKERTEVAPLASANCTHTEPSSDQAARDRATIKHQAAVINGFIELSKRLEERIAALESENRKRKVESTHEAAVQHTQGDKHTEGESPKKKKKKKKEASAHLSSVWYEWFTRVPRVWKSGATRQKKSNSTRTVAFMKLFLLEGFSIDESTSAFEDTARGYGLLAEERVLRFLDARGVNASGARLVLKHMRDAHSEGALNGRIAAYKLLRATEAIADPSPLKSQDILDKILTLNVTAATAQRLVESLSVIFEALALTGERSIELKHLIEWIKESASDSYCEAGYETSSNLAGEQLHGVRKILGSVRKLETKEGEKKPQVVTYFLVDWEPTLEPRKNIPQTLIARSHQERRALVRRTFIEDGATVDNSISLQ